MYVPALTACTSFTRDPSQSNKAAGFRGGVQTPTDRYETDVYAIDPLTGEQKAKIHIPYPNYSGALATAGGLVFSGFTDVLAAFDTSPEQFWSINVGSGFNSADDLRGGQQARR